MIAPRVLLGWEMGGGLGHVGPLLRVADALAAVGCAPVLAVKNLVEPRDRLRGVPYPVVQAPVSPRRFAEKPFLAASYADILAVQGYADPDGLLALVRGWEGLIDLVRPALVIADHSPTLCLAAYGTLPVVLFGIAFAVPPVHLPEFPRLMPDQPSAAPEGRLLEVVREVQRRRGRPAPATLPGLLAAAARFVTALPELDIYREVRDTPAVGPLDPLPAPQPPAAPRFFAYLSVDMPGCEAILAALAGTGCPGRGYVRGADAALRDRLGRQGLELLDRPLAPGALVREAAVVVHHGGSGLAHAALAAGRPQLLFPAHLEHFLNAQRLHDLGVAHYLSGQFPVADIGEGLRQLTSEERFSRRAREIADNVATRGPFDPLSRILDRCRQCLSESRG